MFDLDAPTRVGLDADPAHHDANAHAAVRCSTALIRAIPDAEEDGEAGIEFVDDPAGNESIERSTGINDEPTTSILIAGASPERDTQIREPRLSPLREVQRAAFAIGDQAILHQLIRVASVRKLLACLDEIQAFHLESIAYPAHRPFRLLGAAVCRSTVVGP